MLLRQALQVAEEARAALAPFCDRIEVAGSIRRRRDLVKDVELVAIPRPRELFQFAAAVNVWRKVKGEPTGKYTQRLLPSGIKLDLFLCTPETWACNLVIRTGSADFARALVTLAQKRGMAFRDAQLWRAGARIDVLEEAEVFSALGLPWFEPDKRNEFTLLPALTTRSAS